MQIQYTGRHVEVTSAIRDHVDEQLEKVETLLTGSTTRAQVTITVEKNRHVAEITLHWRDHTLTATDETPDDMYLALTRAADKLEKQSIKLHEKIIGRKQNGKAKAKNADMADMADMDDGAEGDMHVSTSPNGKNPKIIPAKRYTINTCLPHEASATLSESADNFLVFRDPDTERVCVLHKRKDGHHGLIDVAR